MKIINNIKNNVDFGHSIKIGVMFGVTSGTITTLGLITGLSSGTHSKIIILGGIITIAIADAFSDALGIHISEESENTHTSREVWQSTYSTFLSKFITALTFSVPIIFLNLNLAVIISIIWGFVVLSTLSYFIAKEQGVNPRSIIFEHLIIATIVLIITYYVGSFISTFN